MSRRSSRDWSAASATGVSLLFLLAFVLGGLWIGPLGAQYRLFGLVDGLAALPVLYVLLNTEVLSWPGDAWGGAVLVYAGLATAQLIGLLLPPPGVLEWVVLGLLIFFAWNASYSVHRTRIVLGLGLAALALAVLKYSVLPFLWSATQLPRTPIVDLRSLGETFKGLLIAYQPTLPITQFFAFLAILAWGIAVWLQWPPPGERDWVRQLPSAERDRLLYWLLSRRREEGDGGISDEF